jgi:hypothetical protein
MISHKQKFIFIHIPKNAGTTIEWCLFGHDKKEENLYGVHGGIVLQHLKANELQETVGNEIFKTYFKFSFVRNPFSKCVSEYFWEINHLGEHLNFRSWVKLKLPNLIKTSENNNIRRIRQKHNLEQYKFLYNAQGGLIVDFIGKIENLQEDFNKICDEIGIPKQQLPYTNKSKHKHYTEYYDDETKQIVAEKYAKDIEYFGYKFGE